jgi:hypothetical protein
MEYYSYEISVKEELEGIENVAVYWKRFFVA